MSGDGEGDGSCPGSDAAAAWADLLRRGARITAAIGEGGTGGPAIACTPKREVWRDGKASLSRYTRREPGRLGPLLILHGLFGRQTVTDLEPRRSLVAALLAAGADLWVMDWGHPSRADAWADFTDYAVDWLGDALEVIGAETGRRAAIFGICQGGVFALCHAALHPERVAGLALAGTPVDFHADEQDPDPRRGHLNVWARGLDPAVLDDWIAEHGVIPGAVTGAIFQSLNPVKAAGKYTTELLGLADDADALATFLRMERWLSDRPDHPGAAARQWLVELYAENALVAGRFRLDGRPVALGRIECPVLNIVAEGDHIVPPPCSLALERHLAPGLCRTLRVPTGHIGMFVSEKARGLVAPGVADWLGALGQGHGG